jgi:hypothetical protein
MIDVSVTLFVRIWLSTMLWRAVAKSDIELQCSSM